jgi:hypothetical protein
MPKGALINLPWLNAVLHIKIHEMITNKAAWQSHKPCQFAKFAKFHELLFCFVLFCFFFLVFCLLLFCVVFVLCCFVLFICLFFYKKKINRTFYKCKILLTLFQQYENEMKRFNNAPAFLFCFCFVSFHFVSFRFVSFCVVLFICLIFLNNKIKTSYKCKTNW